MPSPAADAPKVNFLRDVAPILNKVGCTSGTCHGAAKGKNGFKLSLRGYDPRVRLRGAALRSVRPALQSRRSRPQPDAGQADAAGAARRRAAHRARLGLLQDHLQLDRAGRAVRRSGEGQASSELEMQPTEVDMAKPGHRAADQSDRALSRWRRARCHQRSRHRQQHSGHGRLSTATRW